MEKMILFDCDGTLIDSEMIAAQVFAREWQTFGIEIDEQFFLTHFVGTGVDAEIVKQTKARLPDHVHEIVEKKFLEELLHRVTAVRGIPEVLSRIQSPMCVASNSDLPYLKMVLEATGLDKFFGNKVYSAHDLGKFKPAPDLFLHAAQESRVEPVHCLVIEDSVAGIAAAKNAGMKVACFLAGLHINAAGRERLRAASADFYCESAEELSGIIQSHLTSA